ncbi:MAG: hypothetical protein GX594_06695, partial [Pirellulaceae bacterium]|nr:hypothetical protein [Pirellulaceae bacterium]
GGTTADKARAHCELRPLDPRRLNPGLDGEFVDLMADLMAKEPQQRISTAREVIERLKPFLKPRPPQPVMPLAPPVVASDDDDDDEDYASSKEMQIPTGSDLIKIVCIAGGVVLGAGAVGLLAWLLMKAFQ